MPATHDNVPAKREFPQGGTGTCRNRSRFFRPGQAELGDGGKSQDSSPQDVTKQDATKGDRSRHQHKTANTQRAQRIAKALVAACHARKRCARPQARHIQADEREEDRCIAEAFGGAKFASQGRRLSLGAKAGAYRSALSMLTFYINRAGKTLPKAQRARLERAKAELKHQFGKA